MRALVSEINGRGFDQLSVMGNQSGDVDGVAAPFATWYLDQFLSSDWGTQRDSAVATLIAEISKSVDLMASVGANRSTTTFTEKDANVARRVLCASTSWLPAGDYDLSVLLSMQGLISFQAGSLRGFVNVPFYNDSSVSGIRLDAENGNALYLLWASPSDEQALRSILRRDRWETITAGFREAQVLVDAISIERSFDVDLRPSSTVAFGTAVVPGLSPWDAIPATINLAVTRNEAQFQIDEDLYGYSVRPTRITVNGQTTIVKTGRSSLTDFSPVTPAPQRFSSLRPMIYAVVNRPTGCILLIGLHT